jgi:hypothetical protein
MADCPSGKKRICACRKPRGVKAGSKRQAKMAAKATRAVLMDRYKRDKEMGAISKRMSFKKYAANKNIIM